MGRGITFRAAALLALVPTVAAAQVARGPVCKDGLDPVGSLGITGIACDRCQFFTNGKIHRAVFWTEPTIQDLDPANPASSVLREGDVLVAVDGQLITTREGSARFSALPPDEDARLRIRRDGKLMELTVPVAAACPLTKPAAAPVVAGRPVPVPQPPTPPRAVAAGAPVAPTPSVPAAPTAPSVGQAAPVAAIGAVPAAPATPTPPVAPVAPAVAPRASLGFGFRCVSCGWRSGGDAGDGRWQFVDPPEVVGLSPAMERRPDGLRVGDRLMELDGHALGSEEGGRRFAAIEPGQSLDWTVERDGRTLHVTTRASEPSERVSAALAPASDPAQAPLRFSGAVGNATVEVRGGRVTVSEDDGGRLVIIRTGDAEIRIRAPGAGGR